MGKSLFIAEKPSVAQAFARALGESMQKYDGYQESGNLIVTWCVGHLVTMSYPDAYDDKYKRWSFDTIPFVPEKFRYEVIRSSAKQFSVVKKLLTRTDVDRIYVCTDSGREGEYIYRLVRQEAGVKGKEERRVWIDSQTDEEIRRGVREAKELSAYDTLSDAAYLRAKEDYLMGINFSRALTLRYGNSMASFLGQKYCVVSVGRVMTCVLGMIVVREREIRDFKETFFYRVFAGASIDGSRFFAEWKAVEGSKYFASPKLYKENGFKKREDAERLIFDLQKTGEGSPSGPWKAEVVEISRKMEKKNPPLLYNLAELQNDCSRMFRISPDQTLNIAQELYEKKLTTYPRTDARVLSTAISREIDKNIRGLTSFSPAAEYARTALDEGKWKTIAKTRYVNDAQITDHYAIIPTGQTGAVKGLSSLSYGVYCQIVKRFLGIFYPPAQYRKISLTLEKDKERFFAGFRILKEEGYLAVMKKQDREDTPGRDGDESDAPGGDSSGQSQDTASQGVKDPVLLAKLEKLKKGQVIGIDSFEIREGKTTPPRRYNSGSMILAMENAGQLIEDEELREQIRTTGIGTSATRAEILKKLEKNQYISLNKKTQILTPTLMGEMIYDVVRCSISALLSPAFTASWEKGLNYVVEGSVTSEEYMGKLSSYVRKFTNQVKTTSNQSSMLPLYRSAAQFYTKKASSPGKKRSYKSSGTKKKEA